MTGAELRDGILHDATNLGVRVTVGVIFIAHSLGKFDPGFASFLGSQGIPEALAYPVALGELVPGILLIVGVLTRASSAVLAMIMIGAMLFVLFGRRWVRIGPAGPIFLAGSAAILSLDAFFPYDTLGPLQYVVPYLVEANVGIINLLDLGTATARDNIMFLRGDFGPMVLQVFWPSAGVHSVIIYSLVMMAFLLKMRIPRGRKAAYFAVGIAGTVVVNMIRIFSLSVYALKVTTDAEQWEAFHQVAGEIMFLPWLFAFLVVVMLVESRRAARLKNSPQDPAGPTRG